MQLVCNLPDNAPSEGMMLSTAQEWLSRDALSRSSSVTACADASMRPATDRHGLHAHPEDVRLVNRVPVHELLRVAGHGALRLCRLEPQGRP